MPPVPVLGAVALAVVLALGLTVTCVVWLARENRRARALEQGRRAVDREWRDAVAAHWSQPSQPSQLSPRD